MARDEDKPKNSEQGPATKASSSEPRAKFDPHVLEDMYPEASKLFAPHQCPDTTDASVVVALDTNVLLLPYGMTQSTSLEELKKAYERLAGRLFVPARVAREFVSRRDAALGNLIKNLNRRKADFPTSEMPAV